MLSSFAGVGQSLKHTLGISYLDDNILKSKTPALISLSYFIRLLGPALGYGLASFSLKVYIAPELTPTITIQDPRWLGAWYMGWIVLGFALIIFVPLMAMFPKSLPRAAVRYQIADEKKKRQMAKTMEVVEEKDGDEKKVSFNGMLATFKRLMTNKVFVLNNVASAFYVFGLQPFWTYTPKLMETLYHTSASASAFLTGTFGLTASALGILTAGIVITKFQPSARKLTLWNVVIGIMSGLAVLSFAFMPCSENERSVNLQFDAACNADCHCDYQKYAPVCGVDGTTYTSACHAGCVSLTKANATKIFESCSCVGGDLGRTATHGPCPVDCNSILVIFIAVKCIMKFLGASGRAANFLVGIRCIEKEDKAVALGFGMAFVRLLASVPSPIFFGYILDSACVVFGKTCSHKGNCWLYDNEHLRYTFNFIAAGCIFIGAAFDFGVWHYSKDLKIFDDDDGDVEKKKKEGEK
jgi:sodium-independent organic anion transporter